MTEYAGTAGTNALSGIQDNGKQSVQPTSAQTWWTGVLAVVAAGSILAVGGALYARLGNLAETQVEILQAQVGMQRDISYLRVGVNDIYTRTAAEEAHGRIFRTDQDQYNLIKGLNVRVRALEQKVE